MGITYWVQQLISRMVLDNIKQQIIYTMNTVYIKMNYMYTCKVWRT